MNFKLLNSNWIWRNRSQEPNQYVTFTQRFTINNTESKLYICCDTNYAAFINNQLVGFGQYLAYPENKYYDIIDITPYTVIGENTIRVEAYYQGISTSCYAKGQPGLIYTIYADGKYIPNQNVWCYKTPGYKEGNIHLITKQLGPAFEYNASEIPESPQRAETLEFSDYLPISLRKRPVKKLVSNEKTQFSPVSWGKFEIKTDSLNPAERMHTSLSVKMDSCADYENKVLTVTEDNTYVILELDGETTGYFSVELDAEEGVRIDVGYGEHLIDGRIRTLIDNRCFAFTYYTKKGINEFTNYYRRIGAKYLQLNFSNITKPLKLKYAGLIKSYYPAELRKKPSITDTLDKKIYDCCVKTLICCMHEHYEDTPWREQSLYAMDSRNQSLFGYSAFKNNTDFTRASIELSGSKIREDGFIDLTSPSEGKRTIPAFTLAWLIWIAEYIAETKNKSFLMVNEKKIDRIISKFKESLKKDILPLPDGERIWNFYDWIPGLSDVKYKEYDAIYNLYFCLALKKLLNVEKYFRNKELVIKMKKLYKRSKKAINSVFYDKKRNLYLTFTDEPRNLHKLTQSLAILSGVSKNNGKLRKKIATYSKLSESTLSMKEFEYEALATDIKTYGDYILKDIRKIWGKMLYEGADTFYETQKGAADFDGAGSLCHGWSAAPVHWYRILFR